MDGRIGRQPRGAGAGSELVGDHGPVTRAQARRPQGILPGMVPPSSLSPACTTTTSTPTTTTIVTSMRVGAPVFLTPSTGGSRAEVSPGGPTAGPSIRMPLSSPLHPQLVTGGLPPTPASVLAGARELLHQLEGERSFLESGRSFPQPGVGSARRSGQVAQMRGAVAPPGSVFVAQDSWVEGARASEGMDLLGCPSPIGADRSSEVSAVSTASSGVTRLQRLEQGVALRRGETPALERAPREDLAAQEAAKEAALAEEGSQLSDARLQADAALQEARLASGWRDAIATQEAVFHEVVTILETSRREEAALRREELAAQAAALTAQMTFQREQWAAQLAAQETARREAEIVRREETATRREEIAFLREQMAMQERSLEDHGGPARGQPGTGPVGVRLPALKLPRLGDGEDIDEFLLHFDSAAEVCGLTPEQRLPYLANSLQGEARQAFNEMPAGSSYETLQMALRRKFRLTPDTYRRRFREARKKAKETYLAFGTRLRRGLKFWVDMAGQSLEDLVLIEQLFWSMPERLSTDVRARGPQGFDDTIKVAQTLWEADLAYVGKPGARSPPRKRSSGSRQPGTGSQGSQGPLRAPNEERAQALKGGTAPPPSFKCYSCGKPGHRVRDCPTAKKTPKVVSRQ